MAVAGGVASRGPLACLRVMLEAIKFEHTVFALPFALMGMMLAASDAGLLYSLPPLREVGWILVAMLGARSAAMAFNRLADARFDAANPRTAGRALPAGLLTRGQMAAFTLASAALFFVAAWQLNPLCFALSPVALGCVLGYSYTKRFTALSHLALGFAIGIAPIGAWIAVTGDLALLPVLLGAAVALWIGGFDILYALQDEAFDRSAGLRSIPAKLGAARALLVSRLLHAGMVGLLVAVGLLGNLGLIAFAGIGVAAALVAYEQSLVKPNDLSRLDLAFFTLNGWIGVTLFLCVAADLALFRR